MDKIFFGFPSNCRFSFVKERFFPPLSVYFKGKSIITNCDFKSSLVEMEKKYCVGGVFLLLPEDKLDDISARLASKLISLGKCVWVCNSAGIVRPVDNIFDFLRKALTKEETIKRVSRPY